MEPTCQLDYRCLSSLLIVAVRFPILTDLDAAVTFGNLVWSLFFAAILVHCICTSDLLCCVHTDSPLDTGIISSEPYITSVKNFTVWAFRCHDLDFVWAPPWNRHKANDPMWHQIFLRGIGANWLVCVAIWVCISSHYKYSFNRYLCSLASNRRKRDCVKGLFSDRQCLPDTYQRDRYSHCGSRYGWVSLFAPVNNILLTFLKHQIFVACGYDHG